MTTAAAAAAAEVLIQNRLNQISRTRCRSSNARLIRQINSSISFLGLNRSISLGVPSFAIICQQSKLYSSLHSSAASQIESTNILTVNIWREYISKCKIVRMLPVYTAIEPILFFSRTRKLFLIWWRRRWRHYYSLAKHLHQWFFPSSFMPKKFFLMNIFE